MTILCDVAADIAKKIMTSVKSKMMMILVLVRSTAGVVLKTNPMTAMMILCDVAADVAAAVDEAIPRTLNDFDYHSL
jgi:hypothetical protein